MTISSDNNPSPSRLDSSPMIAVQPNEYNRSIERVESFFVTTDSVVAKATVTTNGETHSLEVDWGDDERDTLVLDDLDQGVSAFPDSSSGPLPANTYEFYHTYTVSYRSLGGQQYPQAQDFWVSLFAREPEGEFDFRLKLITIKPKYKISFYGLSVGNKDKCDGTNDLNEFATVQTVGGQVVNEWDWKSSNSFLFATPTHGLEGSQLAQVFEVGETSSYPQPTTDLVTYRFAEKDKWYDEIGYLSYPNGLSFYRKDQDEYASGRLEGSFQIRDKSFFAFSCTLMYAVDWELRLLAPIPKYTWPVAIK